MCQTATKIDAKSWLKTWLPALAIAIICVATYWPTLTGRFLWDDDVLVTENANLTNASGLADIWGSPAGFYFPLVMTTFWVVRQLAGLEPLAFHLVSLTCHIATAILLWRLLRRLEFPASSLGALLWAIHPVQVESVAWISELKNTQSGVFFLAAIHCFLNWNQSGQGQHSSRTKLWYGASFLCAILAVLSKTSTVMLPVALLIGLWRTKSARQSATFGLAPFFLISVIAAAWTVWEQKHHSGAVGGEWNESWLRRLVIACNAIWFYFGKLVWPNPVLFIYPRWDITTGRALGSLVGVIAPALVGVLLWTSRSNLSRAFLLVVVYFGAMLFPVAGFFDVYFFRYSYVSDHFQYLASMAPIAAGVAAVATILASRARQAHAAIVLTVLVGATGLRSWQLAHNYTNSESLFAATIEGNPSCWMAHNNLASELAKKGERPEAIRHYEAALRIRPQFYEAHGNLANVLADIGRLEEASSHYAAALKIKPDFAEAAYNWGNAEFRAGRLENAARHYQEAIDMAPSLAAAHFNLGVVLGQLGQVTGAIACYEKALLLKSDYAEAYFNLGVELQRAKRLAEAASNYARALQVRREYYDALNNLGVVLRLLGRASEAVKYLETAVRLQPAHIEPHYNLALALLDLGETDKAVTHFENVLSLNPNIADVHVRLSRIYDQSGRVQEAAAHYARAREIDPNLPDRLR